MSFPRFAWLAHCNTYMYVRLIDSLKRVCTQVKQKHRISGPVQDTILVFLADCLYWHFVDGKYTCVPGCFVVVNCWRFLCWKADRKPCVIRGSGCCVSWVWQPSTGKRSSVPQSGVGGNCWIEWRMFLSYVCFCGVLCCWLLCWRAERKPCVICGSGCCVSWVWKRQQQPEQFISAGRCWWELLDWMTDICFCWCFKLLYYADYCFSGGQRETYVRETALYIVY